jgi:predicted dehydrogenase
MLKIGVIGAGHLGKIHIRLLKEMKTAVLVGFHDHDTATAEKVAAEYGIKWFETPEALIDACDAVDIVTPTVTHYGMALLALEKSKHIFIEKPISTTIAEAEKIVALADQQQVKSQIGHVERFNPAFLAAKEYLSHPMFIETHRLAEFNPRGTDVSVVHDLMIHDIDVVLSVVKSAVKKNKCKRCCCCK